MTQREALLRHPLAIAGAVITTVSAVLFVALVIAMLAGWLNNPYAGLVVFVAIPAVFVIGLLLIPLGMRLQRQKLLRHPNADVDWPVLDFRRAEVRRTSLLFLALTAVNVVIVLLAGYGTLHWMESPSFCGQVCHTPMHPQFTALQNASHARVACVECHIGEGARGFVHAKLSGVRQLIHVATNSFPRPIPPGAEMPPGEQAQTCAKCHQPGRVVGDRIRVIREYADDEANAETITVLQMHLSPIDFLAACDSLACRPRRPRGVRVDRCGARDDPICQSDRREGSGEGIPPPRFDRSSDQLGQSSDHGLHRLPQHGRPPDFTDARTGGGSRHRSRASEPRPSLRSA